jgi:hypothetical protein
MLMLFVKDVLAVFMWKRPQKQAAEQVGSIEST